MLELVVLILFAGYAFWLGQSLLRFFRVSFASSAGWLAASTSLGLGAMSHTVLALGLAGYLTRESVLGTGVLLLFVVMGVPRLLGGTAWWRVQMSVAVTDGPMEKTRVRIASPMPLSVSALLQATLIAAVCLGTLTSALAPPTAGDALCYHLEIPKRFVEHRAVQYLPLTDNSLFPFQMEMLYTLALLFGTPILAQLLHWFVGLLFALAVVELASPLVGRGAGRWAAIVALLVPGVTNQMTAPLNDLALALFCTLMIAAWVKWQATISDRQLVLAGVWGGFALGTKLVAAGVVGMVVLATAIVSLRRGMKHGFRQRPTSVPPQFRPSLTSQRSNGNLLLIFRAISLYTAIVCLVGGIWYARSWYYLGNPIYPYFNGFFGLEPHTRSLLITARNPMTLLWSATMQPEAFGGRGVQFGAVFLAVLPGLALVRWHPQLRSLFGIATGFAAIWFAVRQELRFLLPVVGVFAVGVVVVVRGLKHKHPMAFRSAVLCVACLLSFQTLIVLKRARPCLAVAWGAETRESFLERHEPSYQVARFVNTQLPPDCRLISQDYRGLYFNPAFVREAALRRYWPYKERGEELVHCLTARHFTHILLVQAHNPDVAVYDEGFAERLGAAVDRLPLLLASHFESPTGDRRDYRLYELPRHSATAQGGMNRTRPRVGGTAASAPTGGTGGWAAQGKAVREEIRQERRDGE